jgi:hypothetical protein
MWTEALFEPEARDARQLINGISTMIEGHRFDLSRASSIWKLFRLQLVMVFPCRCEVGKEHRVGDADGGAYRKCLFIRKGLPHIYYLIVAKLVVTDSAVLTVATSLRRARLYACENVHRLGTKIQLRRN